MWSINKWYYGEGSSNSSKQHANLTQEGEGQFTIEKVKVKKLTANAALTAHILSETTRDESTLTYADNGI